MAPRFLHLTRVTLSALTIQSRFLSPAGGVLQAMSGSAPSASPAKTETRAGNERVILDAAEFIFARHGFRGATMQMIADRAGLPKANVHYYFESKLALYRQVVERIFNVWLEAAGSFETSDEPGPALARYIDRKMELSRTHRHGSKVWASEVMQGAPIIQDYLERTLHDWTETRIAVIRRWIDDGLIRPVEPRWLLYMIWATTQHYADFAHQIETLNAGQPLGDAEWESATRTVRTIVLGGLGLDPEAR